MERNDLTGGAVGFAGIATTNITAWTELGLKLEIAGQIGSMPTKAFMRARWGHAFSRDADSTGQIVGLPGSTFSVTGTRTERDVALLAAGATLNVTSAIAIGGRVDAELGCRTQAIRGSASIRWAF